MCFNNLSPWLSQYACAVDAKTWQFLFCYFLRLYCWRPPISVTFESMTPASALGSKMCALGLRRSHTHTFGKRSMWHHLWTAMSCWCWLCGIPVCDGPNRRTLAQFSCRWTHTRSLLYTRLKFCITTRTKPPTSICRRMSSKLPPQRFVVFSKMASPNRL